MDPAKLSDSALAAAEEIADLAQRTNATVGTAESLTSGQIAAHLGAAPASATWFKGGVVAYDNDVKFRLLGVPVGPVISAQCAQTMAVNTRDLLDVDVAVAVTGVGGPTEQEGQSPGLVYVAAAGNEADTEPRRHHFEGSPTDVITATVLAGLEMLRVHLVERERLSSQRRP